jgi:small-conductance mechanosensitive channel
MDQQRNPSPISIKEETIIDISVNNIKELERLVKPIPLEHLPVKINSTNIDDLEIVYNTRDEEEHDTGNCFKNYDFNGFWNKFSLLILAIFILGVSEMIKYYAKDIELFKLSVWKWVRLCSMIPGVYIVGFVVDIIIFLIIDAIGYFERFTTIFVYYMSSFRDLLGHIIITLIFKEYYNNIVGIEKSDTINDVLLLLIIIYLLMSIRNLIVNFFMRKRLVNIFQDNINMVLLYKNIIYTLTHNMNNFYNSNNINEDNDEETYAKSLTINNEKSIKDISWKLIKIKNTGFDVWLNNKKIKVFKKDRMALIANSVWNYLLSKYIKTSDLKTKYKRNNFKKFKKIKITRIPATFLMNEIHLDESNDFYNSIMKLFDPENDTYISEQDFKDAIMQMFQKWKESSTFLVGYNNLSTIFKYLMSFLTYFVIIIAALNIFDIALSSVFVPLATIIVTISFSISRVLSNMAASIVFIIFAEPYAIGQRVNIPNVADNSTLVVKHINILTTTFREIKSGKLITVPNHELYNSNITNHHESQMVIFNILLKINCNTSTNNIKELTQKINDYLLIHPNDWKPDCELYIDNVEHDYNYIMLDYWVQHYSYWGNAKIYDSKTELIQYITEIMDKMNIRYEKPILPIYDITEHLKKD